MHNLKKPAYLNMATMDDFTIHRLWPDVYSHIAFRDETIRDQANQAIKTIKTNGTYDAVYKKYEQFFTGKRTAPNQLNH